MGGTPTTTLPWERFAKKPPEQDAMPKPWERFAPKTEAPAQTPDTTKPSMAQHPFYSGIAEGFGFDPEKLHKYGWSEALKEGVQNLGKFQDSVLKDPFKVANAIEGMGSQAEKGAKEMFHGATGLSRKEGETKHIIPGLDIRYDPISKDPIDSKEFKHGAGLFLATLGQILGGAEGAEKLSKSSARVDGAVKSAAELAKEIGADPGEAARVANNASNGAPSRFFKRKAFEDQYVHAKGLQIAEKFDKAARAVDQEVKVHAENLSKQIDTAIPSGVIDATAEADVIRKEFSELVKTPVTTSPVLVQMLKDAKKPPGMWTFEKTRQFRSSVGRAMGKVSGPQYAVLTRVYRDLTTKLADVAKQHGLTDSWNQYNKLAHKYDTQFARLVDEVRDNLKEGGTGKKVARSLHEDTALTGETVNNLAKYGIDRVEVAKFIKDSKRMLDAQKGWKGTMFRMAYGSPAGVPVMLAVREAGGGWLPSVAAGALAGYGMSYLTQVARAMKLSPEVIDHILSERELPGKLEPPTGKFPKGGEGAPELTEPKEPGGEPEDERIKRLGTGSKETPKAPTEDESPEEKTLRESREQGKRISKRTPKPVDIETPAKPLPGKKAMTPEEARATRVPEGQHGKGKLAQQAKARERISKARGEAKRTRDAEIAEANARAQATEMDTSKLQIPEMEEFLNQVEPKVFRALQKARKLKKFAEQDYEPYLREMVLRAYEKSGGK